MKGSAHADAAQSAQWGQQQLQPPAPSGNKRGGGGGSPEQPQVTQGMWLTESLEHMADTLLGTSRLGRTGTLQGIHSFIENTFIYLLFIIYFILFYFYLCNYPPFAKHWRFWVTGESENKHKSKLRKCDFLILT